MRCGRMGPPFAGVTILRDGQSERVGLHLTLMIGLERYSWTKRSASAVFPYRGLQQASGSRRSPPVLCMPAG